MSKDPLRPNFNDDYLPPTERIMYGEQHGRAFSEQFAARGPKGGEDATSGLAFAVPPPFPREFALKGADGAGLWHVLHKPGGARIVFYSFRNDQTTADAVGKFWSLDGDQLVTDAVGTDVLDTVSMDYGHRMDVNSKGEVIVVDSDEAWTGVHVMYSPDWGENWREVGFFPWGAINETVYFAAAIDEEGYLYVAFADTYSSIYSGEGFGYRIYRSAPIVGEGAASFGVWWSHDQYTKGMSDPVNGPWYDGGDSMTLSIAGSGENAKFAFVVDGWEAMYQVTEGGKSNLGGNQWDDKSPGGGINEYYYGHPGICRSDTTVISFAELQRREYRYAEARWDADLDTWRVTCPFTGTDIAWGYTVWPDGSVSQGWYDLEEDGVNASGWATSTGEFHGGLVQFVRPLPSRFHLLRNGAVAHELGGDTRRIIELEYASDQYCIRYDRKNPNVWVATASALSPNADQAHGSPLGFLISFDDGVTWEERAVDGSAAFRIWGNVMGGYTGGHMQSIDIDDGEIAFAYTYWHYDPQAPGWNAGDYGAVQIFHGYLSGRETSFDKVMDEYFTPAWIGDAAQVTDVRIRRE